MLLEELIGSAPLEDEHACTPRLSREEPMVWLKTVAGFANAGGGTLYVGVEDMTHELVGLTRECASDERDYLDEQIDTHITPRPPYKTSFLRYKDHDDERFVLQVQVSQSPIRPVITAFNALLASLRTAGVIATWKVRV